MAWCRPVCRARDADQGSSKYPNNLVEQDHRAIKRRTQPILGLKDFNCARVILSGIELMHMIKKVQVKCSGKTPLSASHQYCSLVSYAFLYILPLLDPLSLRRQNLHALPPTASAGSHPATVSGSTSSQCFRTDISRPRFRRCPRTGPVRHWHKRVRS